MWAHRSLWLVWAAKRHLEYAAAHGAPGVEFGRFGRALGWRLVRSGAPWGLGWVVSPVSIVRYFEFDFARRCLEGIRGTFLDIGSPRLFSLWMAHRSVGPVTVLNPDRADLARSREAARRLGIDGLDFEAAGADALAGRISRYDAIWSLSVMEHIAGAYDERHALALAWAALKPGGRLVITVPVGPSFRVETRPRDPYGTQAPDADGTYFFQRIYDGASLDSRISATLGVAPEREEYFGERVAGTYAAYEKRWIEHGVEETVADPRLIADGFTRFPSHAAMPGLGVAGLSYVKPRS
jgi:SAM-dependent methyltransferase